MTTYPLDTVCEILKMHPQTVWTALGLNADYGQWSRRKNPDIEYEAIAFAYGLSETNFKRCMLGKDEILTTFELTKLLKVPATKIRARQYPIIVRKRANIRYLRTAVMERHAQRYLDDDVRADGKKPNKKKR